VSPASILINAKQIFTVFTFDSPSCWGDVRDVVEFGELVVLLTHLFANRQC